MQTRNAFGSYYPIDSAIHRLNPVIKLLNFIICILVLFLTNDPYINFFMFGLIIIMMFLSYVPLRFYFNSLWSFRYIYIIIAFACAYFNLTFITTIVYIIKLIIIIEYLNIFVYTTSPSEMVYGIERFLYPFNIFYLPLSKIAHFINKIIRFIPSILTTENRALKAGASRGIDYYHSNILKRIYATFIINKNLFALNKSRTKEIDLNMRFRLFDIKKKRTNYRVNKFTFYDAAFIAFHLLILFAYVTISGLL